MPRKKTTTKTVLRPTTLEQIQSLNACLADCRKKRVILHEKAVTELHRQLEQLNSKRGQAKEKVAIEGRKLKEVKAQLKSKQTKSQTQRAVKQQATLAVTKAKLDDLKAQQVAIKSQLTSLLQSQKKLTAEKKVLAQFEKTWEKSLTVTKKPKKKSTPHKTSARQSKETT